ncbi:MAG TPA: hypothetical protein VK993_11060 [Chthoniobacterales bacterium]|nr:hypothetical protein [Chthoniobacterales bacterium]
MINPNGEGSNNPPGGSVNPGGQPVSDSNAGGAQSSMGDVGHTGGRLQDMTGRMSTAASGAWRQTVQSAGTARERTEFYLRENPVPTVIGALAIGLAIGLAIRYSSETAKEEKELKTSLGDLNLGALSLPFLWPFFKQVQRRYEDTAEVVKDGVRTGVDRVKDVDVDRYVKPLRKKWRSWTN